MGSRGTLIVSGRWDNNVAIVDVEKALDPANDCTDHAVVSRPRVTRMLMPMAMGWLMRPPAGSRWP